MAQFALMGTVDGSVVREIQEVCMGVVHCRYGDDHEVAPVLTDGYVWLCHGAIGVDDAPPGALDKYHYALPHGQCSCGFDPRAPVAAARPAGFWEPGHP